MGGNALAEQQVWNGAFATCCCLLVMPLWVTDPLPLVDLPQHAAQLSVGLRWPADGFPYSEYFELNWVPNPVVPHALSYLLALVFPVSLALKLVLGTALLGMAASTARLVRTLNGDQWCVFTIFPVAYGYAFMWGFVPFVLGVPLGLLLIDTAIRYRDAPTPSRAYALAVLAVLLFACHVLVLAYAGLVSAIIIATSPTWRSRFAGAGALAAVLPVVGAWWAATVALTPDTTPISAPLRLEYGFARIPQLFGFTIGALDVRPADVLLGYLVVAMPFLLGARFTTEWWRWAPLGVCAMYFFSIPRDVLGTAYVYPRFAVFLIPALLVALEPTRRRSRFARAAAVGIAAGSLLLVAGRFQAFGAESAGVRSLLSLAEPNRRMLSLVDDPSSGALPGAPYLHIACWYQVWKGGIVDFSFAEFFPNRFRYRAGMDPPLPYNVEWRPRQFNWRVHGGALYDYFLVRGAWTPFDGATSRVELVARDGPWALYRQTPGIR
jgi:hypothetical protein